MKMKLTIAGKEVELTTEEAKAIYEELAAVFSPRVVLQKYRKSPEVHHHHHPAPTWYEPRPAPDPNRIMGSLRAAGALRLSCIALFLALAVSLQAAPFHHKPAPKPAPPVTATAAPDPVALPLPQPAPETPRFTVNPDGSVTRSRQSDAELRDWIEGIQKEAELQKGRGDKAETALISANGRADSLQKEVTAVTDDRNTQAKAKDDALTKADYWHQKDTEAVKKLWWWRLWAGGAILVGVLLIAGGLLIRFTSWGAKTLGPLVAKAAVIALAAMAFTSCAERPRPIEVLVRAENGEVTVMPPDYVAHKSKH